jgi:glutamate synthase (NADPH/NADH) small chain
MDYGQEEAAAKFGSDPRAYLTTVRKLVGDEQGRLKEIVTVQVSWERNARGQLVPVEQPGTERSQPAQLVLLAMGFVGPEKGLLQDLRIELDERGNVNADYGKYGTNVPGVFAAGDCRRGQSLVVWAINEGRGAARECDRFLMGRTELP